MQLAHTLTLPDVRYYPSIHLAVMALTFVVNP